MKFTHSIGPDLRITFSEKPPEAIRALLKGAGFRWSPGAGCWWRRGAKGAADFLAALDRRLNPDRPDGACWACESPKGFFRPQGPATPVYCNECWNRMRPCPVDMAYEDRCREACGL